jgi:hypothetical protein
MLNNDDDKSPLVAGDQGTFFYTGVSPFSRSNTVWSEFKLAEDTTHYPFGVEQHEGIFSLITDVDEHSFNVVSLLKETVQGENAL